MFIDYSYEQVRITDLNEALLDQSCCQRRPAAEPAVVTGRSQSADADAARDICAQPVPVDSLLIGQGGTRTISKIAPSFVHNTVDNPIFPTHRQAAHGVDRPRGARRQHAVLQAARRSASCSQQHVGRTSFGFRAQSEYIAPVGNDRRCCRSSSAVPRRRVQRARLRHPLDRPDGARTRWSCSAATRACCSTPST